MVWRGIEDARALGYACSLAHGLLMGSLTFTPGREVLHQRLNQCYDHRVMTHAINVALITGEMTVGMLFVLGLI